MASWVTPPVHSTGNFLSLTDWNTIANNETFLYQRPYGQYWNTSGTAATSSNSARVQLGSYRIGYGFTAPSNNVVSIPLAGVYTVSFSVQINTSSGGSPSTPDRFNAQVNQNGTMVIQGAATGTYVATSPVSNGSGILVCNASDQITLVWQNNASATYSTNPVETATFIHLTFVGQA